jgi:signal transduction histidine kinase
LTPQLILTKESGLSCPVAHPIREAMLDRLKIPLTQRVSLKFLVASSLTIAVIFVAIFVWISRQQERHIMDQVKKQATILLKQIVLTRQWVADHTTVLVPKTQGVESNPYLENPDVQTTDGTLYTRIPPSVLTSQLSDRAKKSMEYYFRLTDTHYINPANAPDRIEAEALGLFRSGRSDGVFETEARGEKRVFRYIAPLYLSNKCLECHPRPGAKSGDVAGCLSLFIPMDDAQSAIDRGRTILMSGAIALAASLVILLFVTARVLVFSRIEEIRSAVSRLDPRDADMTKVPGGDELKQIADIFNVLDAKLARQHKDLERKIEEATVDLSQTNHELEEANCELKRLNQAKSDFFSDISHELRTPLTSIKGAADILARKASCEDPTYIAIIRRNADHLIKVVVDFMDYSRLEAGQLELRIEEDSMRSAAEEAILSQGTIAQDKSVILSLRGDTDLVMSFDHQRIYQVLTNLLSNAIRFSPDHGEVTVELHSEDGEARICVTDNGTGIDRKYHEAIFAKFYQVPDQTGKRHHKGSSGIGLAICKGIVNAHGGRIWVESEPGKGSTFCFALPLRG